ncbi:hypothetical protein Q0590_36495 [Rhodocytophaga aerolata]|uniref:DUF4488 domain-containing protein n=1 Tax=Rhodocytophaga aerolata TaxID=455078 RepID=A0ABT8RL98_9BACT|nr:hypothetical protein [Rhodocytophaga aerolata]MDO1451827.1 hypothetical protein [Rhodocytophaga aerolata]
MRLLFITICLSLSVGESLAQKKLTSKMIVGEWKIIHYPYIKVENQGIVHLPLDPKAELLQPSDTLISFNEKQFLINQGAKEGKYKIKVDELSLNGRAYLFFYDSEDKFRLVRIINDDHRLSYYLYRIK